MLMMLIPFSRQIGQYQKGVLFAIPKASCLDSLASQPVGTVCLEALKIRIVHGSYQ